MTAVDICRRWHDEREYDEDFSRRLEVSHGPDWQVPPYAPTIAQGVEGRLYRWLIGDIHLNPFWASLGAPPYWTCRLKRQ